MTWPLGAVAMTPESAGISLTEAIAVLPLEAPAEPLAELEAAAEVVGAVLAVLLEAQAAQANSAAPEPAMTVRRGQVRMGVAANSIVAWSVSVWAIIDMV